MSNSTAVRIRVSPEFKDRVESYAKSKGIGVSQVLRNALRLYLDRNRRVKALPQEIQDHILHLPSWTAQDWRNSGFKSEDMDGTNAERAIENLRNYYAYCVDLQHFQPTKE